MSLVTDGTVLRSKEKTVVSGHIILRQEICHKFQTKVPTNFKLDRSREQMERRKRSKFKSTSKVKLEMSAMARGLTMK